MALLVSWYELVHVPWWTVLLWLVLWGSCAVAWCMVVATVVRPSRVAVWVGPLVLIATALPRYLLFGLDAAESEESGNVRSMAMAKMLASLFPATAFMFAADCMIEYDDAVMESKQLWDGDGFTFQTALFMMLVDTVLCGVISWTLSYCLQYKRYAIGQFLSRRHTWRWWRSMRNVLRRRPRRKDSFSESRSASDDVSVTGRQSPVYDAESLSEVCVPSQDEDSCTSTVRYVNYCSVV